MTFDQINAFILDLPIYLLNGLLWLIYALGYFSMLVQKLFLNPVSLINPLSSYADVLAMLLFLFQTIDAADRGVVCRIWENPRKGW